jgi:hypothetical protein
LAHTALQNETITSFFKDRNVEFFGFADLSSALEENRYGFPRSISLALWPLRESSVGAHGNCRQQANHVQEVTLEKLKFFLRIVFSRRF